MVRRRDKPVKEFMSKEPVSIDKDEQISVALELMNRKGITHLVVLTDSRVVGVIAAWDLMEGLGSARFQRVVGRRIYVSTLMSEPPITISEEDSLDRAISLLYKHDISFLPVVNDKKALLGAITESDLVRLLSEESSPTVKDLMMVNYPRMQPIERIVHARARMLETGARALPVVGVHGQLVGLVTDLILANAFMEVREEIDPKRMDAAVRKILVEDVMMESPPALKPEDPLGKAASLLADSGLPALPVISPDGILVGVLPRKSLLKLI
ncbi:MAG TPA: CBS domain-containing protein [Candidatus Korarchaeota archaeon]|nr:CBS domain-containing protein [Candidatus Korarchaeota archaeon]